MEKFKFEKIDNFDEHIRLSIPNYDLLLKSTLALSEYFLVDGMLVYDLGCSTGTYLRALKHNGPKVGVDKCRALLPADDSGISFIEADLDSDFKFDASCLICAMFTLQFLQPAVRSRLVNTIYTSLCSGGAFIFGEKVYAVDAMLQEIFTFVHYDYKKESFSDEQILKKERSLRNVLKPNSSGDNRRLLLDAGFKRVEMFYKFLNFEAFVAVK